MATAKIPLTGKLGTGKYALVDREDYDKLSQYKWNLHSTGYVMRGEHIGVVDGKKKVKLTKLHREVMGFPKQGLDTDHINRDKLDNRKSNLRLVTHRENVINSSKYSTNRSGVRGVYKKGSKWAAQIRVNTKAIYLGTYTTVENAAKAYKSAAKEYGYGD